MGMWGFTGLDSRVYSSRGIAFATGLTMRDQDTPTGGVIKVAITAAGDLWANATTPASNTTTGALVVAGGVGIGGNLYVGAGIQGTDIGNTTAATGWFTTLSAVNNLWANASIATTTQGTGAIVIPNGGISVSGAANIGSTLTVVGATQLNSTLGVGGISTFTNSTNATNGTDGAVIIQGGASIVKDLWVGGNLYAANIVGVTANVITVMDPLLYLRPGDHTFPYNYQLGIYSAFTGPGLSTLANVYQHTGVIRDPLTNAWTFASNLAEPTASYVTFDGTTVYDPIKAGNLTLVNGVAATNATSGALQVLGGAGITGALYVGSGIQNTVIGNTTAAAGYFTSLNATGNVLTSTVGSTITAGSFVVGVEYTILTLGTTSFTAIGASANTVGVVFTATGVGSGTGTATINTWTSAVLAAVGVNQTWSLPTRVSGTSYTNSTGKPIQALVTIGQSLAGSGTTTIVVGGVTIVNSTYQSNATGGSQPISFSFIVPNSTAYTVTVTSGASIGVWAELR
jgi:hypothetical protein